MDAQVHIAAEDIPAYVRACRRQLRGEARTVRAHPNTETAEVAAARRDTRIGVLRALLPQVEDAMLRAEIMGLVSYYSGAV